MLKENLIRFIKEHPESVDMNVWLKEKDNACGTVGCLAGLIVFVANDCKFVLKHRSEEIAQLARKIWAKEYGEEAAQSLPFYSCDWRHINNKNLSEVKAEDLVNWLEYKC